MAGDRGFAVGLVLVVLAACGDDRAVIGPDTGPDARPDGADAGADAGPPDASCGDGFVATETGCADIDECALDLDRCDARAACTNTPGAFTCTCPTGWIGDGTTCALAACRHHYRAGHGDMYTTWDGTGLAMAVRSELEPGNGERAYPPLEVCIHVPRASYDEVVALGGRPPGPGWDPIGVEAGAAFWLLPETPLDGMPWFGVASDVSPAGGVPVGVFGPFLTLRLRVDGPADSALAAWASVDDPEAPPFRFSTVLGLDQAQVFTSSHAHLSWSFSRPGEYLVEATIRGTHVATEQPIASPPVIYRFVVEE